MDLIMHISCNSYHFILDRGDSIYLKALILISSLDVHVQRTIEKSFNNFQILGFTCGCTLLIKKAGKYHKNWKTFAVGLPRSLANFTIAFGQRYT